LPVLKALRAQRWTEKETVGPVEHDPSEKDVGHPPVPRTMAANAGLGCPLPLRWERGKRRDKNRTKKTVGSPRFSRKEKREFEPTVLLKGAGVDRKNWRAKKKCWAAIFPPGRGRTPGSVLSPAKKGDRFGRLYLFPPKAEGRKDSKSIQERVFFLPPNPNQKRNPPPAPTTPDLQ